jgi:Fic family protein
VLIGQIQQERAADRLVQAVDELFELPILSIPQLAAALEVPYMSASRYVERLVQLGILEEITGQARNRVYRAPQILQEINR